MMLLILIICSVTLGEPTLRDKIAQMLMFSFPETYVTESSDVVKALKAYKMGGLILFGANVLNPTQLLNLTTNLQKYSMQYNNVPLFIAVDEEGGYVARLSPTNGFPTTYSAYAIATHHNYTFTYDCGANIGKTLASMKINMNFAPDTDLLVNPNNPIIAKYNRSFSADPTEDTMQARQFIKGLHDNNVMSTIKHFPGHGSSTSDSHLGFVDVTDTWQTYELDPFRNLANETDVVMVAHIFNKKLDDKYPASLSKKTIEGILRSQLNFAGLVATDSLAMGAITQNYSYEEALILAVNAGNDLLLVQSNDTTYYKLSVDIIETAVKNGKISTDRINESYNRIMAVKNKKIKNII